MTSTPVRGHIVCAGLPDQQTDLVAALLHAVLERSGRGPVSIYTANDAQDHLVGSLAHGATTTILRTDRPDTALIDACARAHVPVVLAVPDLERWTQRLLLSHNEDVRGAQVLPSLHAMFELAAPLLDLGVACEPLLVTGADLTDDLARTVRKLADHVGVDQAGQLPAPADGEANLRIATLHHELQAELRSSPSIPEPLAVVAREYTECFAKSEMSLSFGTALLPKGLTVTERRAGVIDLTGQAGPITFGPLVRLPRGPWRGRYTFAVASNMVDVPLRFSVAAMSRDEIVELARTDYVPHEFGEHEVEISFEVPEPLAAIDLSVSKLQAMFEGDFAIGSVVFSSRRREKPARGALYDHLAGATGGGDRVDTAPARQLIDESGTTQSDAEGSETVESGAA